jgi:ABC-type branched-subunit amino acid transport system substrate-binding protein
VSELRVGLAVSLTGPLAPMGTAARRGLELWAEEARAGLVVRDDGSERARVRRAVEMLLDEERVDLLAGPYSSSLTRAVAPIAEARNVVLWNHGGAADGIHRRGHRCVVGILAPASRYLVPALRQVRAGEVVVVHRPSSGFSAAVARGAVEEAGRQGRSVRLESYPETAEDMDGFAARLAAAPPGLLAGAGRFSDDVALARALRRHGLGVPTAFVAAGIDAFGKALGAAVDGSLGPSQWEARSPVDPDVGPAPADFAQRFQGRFGVAPDYPAAQAYAAGLVMGRCVETAEGMEGPTLRAAAAALDVTTLLGRFRIDPVTGIQIGHGLLLVRWEGGERRVIAWDRGE